MPDRTTVPDITARKGRGSVVMVTAYDAPTTRWGEESGADVLLVGDSLAMVVLGHETTLDVTLDEMLHHARAVRRASRRCLLVGDLPFGSYQGSVEQAVASATRFLKEGGMQAVKLEGLWPELVRALVRAGIPVMGHLGLTPQSVHQYGGYKIQGRSVEAAKGLMAAACELEESGCFAIVLEGIPSEVASVVTDKLTIPTIGIGAGVGCDGQVLVVHDVLGICAGPLPRFVAEYGKIEKDAIAALAAWAGDVRAGRIPTDDQSYHLNPDAAALWRQETEKQ
jgi:3-methyl-2-oxobutanoate hydroxymethyltransferase